MRYLLFLLFVSLFLIIIQACDKIEPPFIKENDNIDTTECPIPDFPAITNPKRIILLEEFTGHKCPNCPGGAAIAHNLLNMYPSQLALAAIHAGYFATADNNGDFSNNYTITEGEDYAAYFNVILNPIGMINRTKYNNATLINPGDWGAAIDAIINQPPDIFIQTIPLLRTEDNSFCIHNKITFMSDMQGEFNLCVFITEDSIISPQKTSDVTNYPSGIISDYSHNHVLRKVLGGTWGKNIGSGQLNADSSSIHTFKLIPHESWNLNKCKIITFVYNTENDEVVQAAIVNLLLN